MSRRKDASERFSEFLRIPKLRLEKLGMQDLDNIEELVARHSPGAPAVTGFPTKGSYYPQSHFVSVKELVTYAAGTYGSRTFILDKSKPRDKEWKTYTFSEFYRDVNYLGTALIRRYIDPGDPIVVIGENQYEWYVSYIAALTGAGIAVPLDKELPLQEIELTINRSRATAVIYSHKLRSQFRKLMDDDRLPTVRYFIEMKCDDGIESRHVGFDKVMMDGEILVSGGNTEFIGIETDPDEFRALFFTSGTTANSKGVMASSRQLANNVNAVSAYVNIKPDDRFLSVLPLHHTYESSIGFLLMFGTGSSVAVCQGLRYIADNMKETQPTFMIAVPLLIEHLYASIQKNIRKSDKEKLVSAMMQTTNVLKNMGVDIKRQTFREIYEGLGGRLRCIVSAAAPIDPKIGKWFSDLGIMFLQGYGLTETCPISAVTPDFDTRVGSAGKTIVGGIIRVDDPDENGVGELVISTDTLMMGYYEDEDATAEVIETDENGRRWFHSGDLGYVDEDGYVYITGRMKSVIVTQNGKNIYPEELELLLSDIAIVAECMVYGRESADGRDLTITARVIPDYDRIRAEYGEISIPEIHELLMKEIRRINKRTTNYKAIKAVEIKDGPFIKTSTQKIKRYAEIKDGKILDVK